MLPPYGLFSLGFRELASKLNPMSDWLPDLCETDRKNQFLMWKLDVREKLSNTIWPYYDRESDTWCGAAKSWAKSATLREVGLMIDRYQGANSEIRKSIDICHTTEFGDTHLDQFEVEDDPNQPAGVNLRDYICDLTESQFRDTRSIIDAAYRSKKLPGLFWFKKEFVRTRPYQTAHLASKWEFELHSALSARHSSFHSGHCLEGIIFNAAVAEHWLSKPDEYSQSQLEALGKYTVDFGDRRVFAGVHFPSDNIGSWIIALSLIPFTFADSRPILNFVETAITKHSKVYKHIVEAYAGDSELSPGLDLLHQTIKIQQNKVRKAS